MISEEIALFLNESFHFVKDSRKDVSVDNIVKHFVQVDSKGVNEYVRRIIAVFTLATWRGDVRMARAHR
jgi:hypothetical protein